MRGAVLTEMGLMALIPERQIFERANQAVLAAAGRMSKEVCTACSHAAGNGCVLAPAPAGELALLPPGMTLETVSAVFACQMTLPSHTIAPCGSSSTATTSSGGTRGFGAI